MAIEKINSLALSSIAEINSTAKASIAKFNGSEATSVSLTDYVSSGLEMHFNAGDENSYNSSTNPSTWTDISSNGYSMALNNGPTEPNAGDNYIQFDGVDDYGEISVSSGDYFYGTGSASGGSETHDQDQYTFMAVLSFPENGSTGYVVSDAYCGLASRRRRQTYSSSTRGTLLRYGLYGFDHSNYYGSLVRLKPPSNMSTYFHYNSSRSQYELKPNTKIHVAMTVDLTSSSSNNLICYINGQTFTASASQGSMSNLSGSSANLTYDTTSQIKDGSQYWHHGVSPLNTQYNGNPRVSSNSLSTNTYELMMYNRVLSATEIEQNFDAYVDRYGAI
jgi:hypothetical protein